MKLSNDVEKYKILTNIEYSGVKKQVTKNFLIIFLSSFFVLSQAKFLKSIAYQLKQLLSYLMHRMTSLSL